LQRSGCNCQLLGLAPSSRALPKLATHLFRERKDATELLRGNEVAQVYEKSLVACLLHSRTMLEDKRLFYLIVKISGAVQFFSQLIQCSPVLGTPM
jgi:hypothetical protein